MKVDGYTATSKFLEGCPGTEWPLVLRACLACFDEPERQQEFPGRSALQKARSMGVTRVQNLKPLCAAGILRKTEDSKGGHRAYYAMIDPEGVRRALRELDAKEKR